MKLHFNEEKEIESKIDTKWQFAKWEKRQRESKVIGKIEEKRKKEGGINKKETYPERSTWEEENSCGIIGRKSAICFYFLHWKFPGFDSTVFHMQRCIPMTFWGTSITPKETIMIFLFT